MCWERRSSRRQAALQELMDVFESDSDASQAIMTAASERGQWREVLSLHQRLLQSVEDVPEKVGEVYANAASGLMRASQWQRALGLITDFRAGCADSLSFWSASADSPGGRLPMFQLLLSTSRNSGSWEQAVELLQDLRSCPEALTAKAVASTVTTLTYQNQWRMALRVFDEFRDAAGTDQHMYKAAMQAWSCGHHWRQVIVLLAEQQETLGENEGIDAAMGALCQATISLQKTTGSKLKTSTPARAASRMLADMRLRQLLPTRRLYNQAGRRQKA